MIRSNILSFPPLALALLACQPAEPPGETGGGTGASSSEGGSGTSAGTASSTDGSLDSGEDTTAGTVFACEGARWYEGTLLIDATTDLDSVRDVGGVTGALDVYGVATMDLEFLSCLEVVEGRIAILRNDFLTDLRGLERLRVVNGTPEEGPGPPPGNLSIIENPALIRIDALESLETIESIWIDSNSALTEIEMPALVEVGRLKFGDSCELGSPQWVSGVGTYPSLEHIGFLELQAQYGFSSLTSLMDLVDAGVTFGGASFRFNSFLPESEIDVFGAAASIVPESCSNAGSTEICRQCPVK
jgi:hypothetical protein